MTSIGLLVTLYGLWLFYGLASAEETNFISYKKVLRNSIRQHLDYRPKRVVIPTISGFSSTKLIRHSSESLLLNMTVPKVQKGGIVIMATANSGYLDMLLNWKYFMDELGVTNYVVIPLDARVAQQLNYLGVPWAYDPDIGLDANPVAGQDLSLLIYFHYNLMLLMLMWQFGTRRTPVVWTGTTGIRWFTRSPITSRKS